MKKMNCERVEDSPFPRGLATELQSPILLQEDFTSLMNLRYISQSSFLLLGYKQFFTYILGRKAFFINKCLKRSSRCSPPSA